MDSQVLRFLIHLALGAVVYTLIGRLIAYLWQELTYPELDADDIVVIRRAWPVFASIGMALLMVYALDVMMDHLLRWIDPRGLFPRPKHRHDDYFER